MSHAHYDSWTREQLVARLHKLDLEEKNRARATKAATRKKFREQVTAEIDFSKAYRRKIAFKFCYDGWDYNGLAIQGEETELPTVEETLLKALYQKRLIDPGAGMAGCDWARCGRTDKGVSAAGQVVSLYVRSNLRSGPGIIPPSAGKYDSDFGDLGELAFIDDDASPDSEPPPNGSLDTSRKEFPFVSMLNRALPASIRVLAWAPVTDKFSARHSCRYRHYRYFFSPRTTVGETLNIDLMREAASHLLGEHDFRNYCKLDAAKQITNFRRRIDRADLSPIDPEVQNGLWVFNLIGTAFLWHQVRHIMAVLFMVGTGAEPLSLVRALLNADGSEGTDIATVPCKPEYEMADALPLVLWDCAYSPEDVTWVTDAEATADAEGDNEDDEQLADAPSRLLKEMASIKERSQIQSTMHAHFLEAAHRYRKMKPHSDGIVTTQLGGGRMKTTVHYVPVLNRKRQAAVETLNAKWRETKGARRSNRTAAVDDE
ncbi:pseudouridine synthase [Auriculariales sp. MPI-PUGE-AT-0066]|nr:pseudouridine synthase [Auriculariales sp. MPI-PUGE-AT-0066]